MFISHVLYKVNDLSQAVDKLKENGFTVHTPSDPKNAFHAIIWFEEGPYLELIVPNKSMVFPPWLMHLTGYGLFVKRQKKWDTPVQGWCDVGLESYEKDLSREKNILKQHKIRYKQFRPKVKNEFGQAVSWYNVVTSDIYFPFLVSAYSLNPRPDKVTHPNGIKEVDKVFIGKRNLNHNLFRNLMTCEKWYEIVEGEGVQTVSFKGTNLKWEEIIN